MSTAGTVNGNKDGYSTTADDGVPKMRNLVKMTKHSNRSNTDGTTLIDDKGSDNN